MGNSCQCKTIKHELEANLTDSGSEQTRCESETPSQIQVEEPLTVFVSEVPEVEKKKSRSSLEPVNLLSEFFHCSSIDDVSNHLEESASSQAVLMKHASIQLLQAKNKVTLRVFKEASKTANLSDIEKSPMLLRLAKCYFKMRDITLGEPEQSKEASLVKEFLSYTALRKTQTLSEVKVILDMPQESKVFSQKKTDSVVKIGTSQVQEKKKGRGDVEGSEKQNLENLELKAENGKKNEFVNDKEPEENDAKNEKRWEELNAGDAAYVVKPLEKLKAKNRKSFNWRRNSTGSSLGPITDEKGNIYFGEFMKGKKHGWGKQVWKNEALFEGYWYDGMQNGFGLMVFPDGDIYFGEWLGGHMQGYGIFQGSNLLYEGEFNANEPSGFCMETLGETTCIGTFSDGTKTGRGLVTFPWGEYLGPLKAGRAERPGRISIGGLKIFAFFREGSVFGKFRAFLDPKKLGFSPEVRLEGTFDFQTFSSGLLAHFKDERFVVELKSNALVVKNDDEQSDAKLLLRSDEWRIIEAALLKTKKIPLVAYQ